MGQLRDLPENPPRSLEGCAPDRGTQLWLPTAERHNAQPSGRNCPAAIDAVARDLPAHRPGTSASLVDRMPPRLPTLHGQPWATRHRRHLAPRHRRPDEAAPVPPGRRRFRVAASTTNIHVIYANLTSPTRQANRHRRSRSSVCGGAEHQASRSRRSALNRARPKATEGAHYEQPLPTVRLTAGTVRTGITDCPRHPVRAAPSLSLGVRPRRARPCLCLAKACPTAPVTGHATAEGARRLKVGVGPHAHDVVRGGVMLFHPGQEVLAGPDLPLMPCR